MIEPALHHLRSLAGLACFLAVVSCKPAVKEEAHHEQENGELLRFGSVVVTQADLDYQLKEKHGGGSDEATRQQALEELTARARFTQAAYDAGLADDPVARAEISRILVTRLKEKLLYPKLKDAAAPVPESRLREIYESRSAGFQAAEKRQAAVLWLNPGADPERGRSYQEKLSQARAWLFNDSDLANHPDKGFSVLSVDYSEHAATRFKGGVFGWIDREGGGTDWTRAVAEITYSLKEVGEVSPVIVRPEGVFLVRWMALKPAVKSPFESVRSMLEREEQGRLRNQLEQEFEQEITSKYPAVGN